MPLLKWSMLFYQQEHWRDVGSVRHKKTMFSTRSWSGHPGPGIVGLNIMRLSQTQSDRQKSSQITEDVFLRLPLAGRGRERKREWGIISLKSVSPDWPNVTIASPSLSAKLNISSISASLTYSKYHSKACSIEDKEKCLPKIHIYLTKNTLNNL